jgi:1-acyl-sn-glycerol-3-phosphate acyltransferase
MRSWWWACIQTTIRFGGTILWQMRVFGAENIPPSGGILLASNHQSYLDPALVGACIPREMHFMARRSLFEVPVFGGLIRRCHAFPVDRDGADLRSLREAIARLRAGYALLVFPEGTRTRDGRIGPMKSGIRILAERAEVPVAPVLIEGAHQVWPKGRALLPGLGRVRIVFGKPLPRESDYGESFGERVRDAIVRLKGELAGCRIASS